ncbi:MAG: FecR domain-containing protein, partial [Candidatus Marinimicrobia bacterium]|nr:FecR domain-containing protein [Candidatus Neomarinimicrobiota bacterium]
VFGVIAGTASAESIARVMKAQGEVLVKRMGGEDFSETVAPGVAINNGDALKVGEQSFAVVVFIDDRSVIKVKEQTEFEFIDSESTRTLKIENGTLINNIADQGRTKTFRIETPTSVASVKGTEFTAIVNSVFGVDQFLGTSGLIDVLNLISQQIVSIGAGQKAISNIAGALIQAPALPNEYPGDPDTDPEPQPEPGDAPTDTDADTGDADTDDTTPDDMQPAPEEVAPPEDTGEAAEDSPYNFGLGIGSVTIDGVIYNQFALRPEFSFGKLGVGLDLVIYLDNEGNVRKEDWDVMNDPSVIMDKIMYLSWAKKGDPFWARFGTLSSVTLGYGGLLNGYSNMMEYPSVRQLGLNLGVRLMDKLNTEIFLSNMKDLVRGGTLMGARASYTLSEAIPLTIGANMVVDINQFSGLKDLDGDDVPDVFDAFPEDEFTLPSYYFAGAYGHNPGDILKGGDFDVDSDGDGIPDEIDYDRDGDGLTDQHPNPNLESPLSHALDPTPFNKTDSKASIIGLAADIGYPIFSNNIIAIDVYSEFNQLIVPEVTGTQYNRPSKTGTGITIPGIKLALFKMVHLNVEYRIKSGYFVPRFFDQSYDISRVMTVSDGSTTYILTKDQLVLTDDTSLSGYFGSAGWDVFGFANVSASYANMKADTTTVRSFSAVAGLNTDWIPKLSRAAAYYIRNNDENPFDFKNPTVNTIFGYQLGYEVSAGVSLIWNFSQFYRDTGDGLKPVRLTTIETTFDF